MRSLRGVASEPRIIVKADEQIPTEPCNHEPNTPKKSSVALNCPVLQRLDLPGTEIPAS